jgi:hypothetical protein
MREGEIILWLDASKELPDAESEVLVCFQQSDGAQIEVTLAIYDDSNEDSPWETCGGVLSFGKVLFWAEKPFGPQSTKRVDESNG